MGSYKLISRHWVVDEKGRIIIGDGRQEILESIEKTGSLNQTAKIMKMSYKGVWSKIKATESYFKMRIVDTSRKRGSFLTIEGKELLRKYAEFKDKCTKAEEKIFKATFG